MRYRLACFDLDGTLADSGRDIGAAIEVALAAVGPSDPARDAVARDSAGQGLSLEEFFALARPELAVDASALRRFIDAYRAHYHANLLRYTTLYEGVAETLEGLAPLRARGLRTAVATTKKTDTARRVIEGLGLGRCFDAVLGTDGIPHKPAPDLLHLAARTTSRSEREGIMVGDTPRDLQAGRAAGMATCAVAWGVLGEAGIAAYQPDHLVRRFSEIAGILAGT